MCQVIVLPILQESLCILKLVDSCLSEQMISEINIYTFIQILHGIRMYICHQNASLLEQCYYCLVGIPCCGVNCGSNAYCDRATNGCRCKKCYYGDPKRGCKSKTFKAYYSSENALIYHVLLDHKVAIYFQYSLNCTCCSGYLFFCLNHYLSYRLTILVLFFVVMAAHVNKMLVW